MEYYETKSIRTLCSIIKVRKIGELGPGEVFELVVKRGRPYARLPDIRGSSRSHIIRVHY